MPRPPATTTSAPSRSTASVISVTSSTTLAFTAPSGTGRDTVSMGLGSPASGRAKQPDRTVANFTGPVIFICSYTVPP